MLLQRKQKTLRHLKTTWLEGGKSKGPLLLLLHGYPDGPEIWEGQIEYFAKDYHLLCPYVRGTLYSEGGGDLARFSMDSLCLDLLQLVELSNYQKAKGMHIVGHDLGGAIAWRLATYLSHQVDRLVIINSLSLEQMANRLIKRPEQWIRSWYILPMLVPYLPEYMISKLASPLSRFAYKLGGLQKKFQPAKNQASVLSIETINQYRAFARELPSLFGKRPTKIHTPTLVLWGNRDPFLLPPTMDELEPSASNLTVRILEGSHWLFRENPQLANKLISDFIEEGVKHAASV